MIDERKSQGKLGEEQGENAEPFGEHTNPKMKWYVVHTHSGMENKAKKSLEERIEQYAMQDKFGEILVPTLRPSNWLKITFVVCKAGSVCPVI